MLGLKSCIIDTLGFSGGQCSALYAEKPIYDIAGYPSISAEELIKKIEPNKNKQFKLFEKMLNSIDLGTSNSYLINRKGIRSQLGSLI